MRMFLVRITKKLIERGRVKKRVRAKREKRVRAKREKRVRTKKRRESEPKERGESCRKVVVTGGSLASGTASCQAKCTWFKTFHVLMICC